MPAFYHLTRSGLKGLFCGAILCSVFFVSSARLYAQTQKTFNTVTIEIVDTVSKQPVNGVNIYIRSLGVGAATITKGTVQLPKIPEGDYLLEISCLGYEPLAKNIQVNSNQSYTFAMTETSLQLKEVSVVAKSSAAGVSTSSKIERQAIDHLQATNLGDLMQLLPGQLMQNSDLTSTKQLNFRNANTTTDANNAFGASVIVDGVPLSNNAAMNSRIGNNTSGSGVDVRQIGTDNIESVEIIRGIPSAEYGDLSTGGVIVKTKTGKTPYEIRTKVNPTTINSSLNKGWELGDGHGTLNASVDYAQAWGDPRTKTRSFDRINTSITYANTLFKKMRTQTKLGIGSLIDWQGQDPDATIEGTTLEEKELIFNLNHEGKIALNLPLSRTLTYTLGFSGTNRDSHQSKFISKNGIIPIITATETGYYDIQYQSMSYKASGGEKSTPRNFYAKIKNTFGGKLANTTHQINMGLEYRYEVNQGRGYYNDDDSLPLSPNSDGRPIPYYSTPGLNQLSGYIEDNIGWKIGKTRFKLQAGLRYSHLQPGKEEQVWALSPRLNGSVKLTNWLDIRFGVGQSAKTPGLVHLYPHNKYYDKQSVNTTGANNPAERMLVYHTYVYDVQRTVGLKNATTTKYEFGFDIKLPNERNLSIVGYYDKTPNGFNGSGNQVFFTSNVYNNTKGLINNPGSKPTIDWNNPARIDTVWISTGEYNNTNWSLNRGIEFDFDLGRIESWNTRFYFSGAYLESSYKTVGYSTTSPGNRDLTIYPETNTTPFKYIYKADRSIDINRRFNTQLRAVLNIPSLRMVFSSSMQVIWYSYDATKISQAAPVGYMVIDETTNSFKSYPITQEMLNDKNYKIRGLLLSDAILTGIDKPAVTQPPIMLVSTRLTKDISKMAGFSFYVNNTFFHQPWQHSSISNTLTERNSGTFNFGMELYFKF